MHNSALQRLHSLSAMFSVTYLLTCVLKAKHLLAVWEFCSDCFLCLCGSDPGLTFNEQNFFLIILPLQFTEWRM